jgi:hypothetical protein
VTHKCDASVLKKADRRAIISQVKNWINQWVNYGGNGAEYLKSFALFTAFINRPDIEAYMGECRSYIMETYIAKTGMQKKEKLLLYNNFDQCTSCPAEHENCEKW